MTTIRFGAETPSNEIVTLRGRMVRTTTRSNVLRGMVIAAFAVFILGLALYATDRRNTIQANCQLWLGPPGPCG
jgi:hypothetical protein